MHSVKMSCCMGLPPETAWWGNVGVPGVVTFFCHGGAPIIYLLVVAVLSEGDCTFNSLLERLYPSVFCSFLFTNRL